jgi:predicted  nucleic acid-binding Zn-ribbon protein
MKRTELEALGLSKEQIDNVMTMNGTDIENAKKVATAETESLQNQIDSLQMTLKERNKQLEDLQKSTGNVDDLKQQIATLQADNKAKDEEHAKELMQLKVDTAVEKALTGANAKNLKAVKALLDLTDAKLDKDGNVKGLSEQIEKLTTGEDTKFLFDAPQQTFKGFQPGASAQQKPGIEVDTSKMNYDELCAYLAENPDAKLE